MSCKQTFSALITEYHAPVKIVCEAVTKRIPAALAGGFIVSMLNGPVAIGVLLYNVNWLARCTGPKRYVLSATRDRKQQQ